MKNYLIEILRYFMKITIENYNINRSFIYFAATDSIQIIIQINTSNCQNKFGF